MKIIQRPFIGRSQEIKRLDQLLTKKTSSIVAICGRRRIGKSRLVEEFARHHPFFYSFSGLPPEKNITAQDQRNAFVWQLSKQTSLPNITLNDWADIFQLLANECKQGRIIILLDEITWMAQDDPTFLVKLRDCWETHLKKNPQLILVLCGSVSGWIEKNIISSTGYFGRISLYLTLEELPLTSCNELFEDLGFKRSAWEKLIYLAVTGGVPWYIEQVLPNVSVLENIKQLCFKKEALLVKEYKHIFHDLFGNKSALYEKIVSLLAKGDLEYQKISEQLEYAKGSGLTDYLNDLVVAGYVSTYSSWSLKTTKLSKKLKKYRLTDNYLRFYFRYMLDKMEMINRGRYEDVIVDHLPGFESMMGLQFENLIIKNQQLICQSLGLNPLEIIADGPYYQTKTARTQGCQIDYLIQTKHNTLYVCEIKFSRQILGVDLTQQVREKINRMSLPRHFAVLPVLICAGDVSDAVKEEGYFCQIIDVREFFIDQKGQGQ